jgi:hypothetical protein
MIRQLPLAGFVSGPLIRLLRRIRERSTSATGSRESVKDRALARTQSNARFVIVGRRISNLVQHRVEVLRVDSWTFTVADSEQARNQRTCDIQDQSSQYR